MPSAALRVHRGLTEDELTGQQRDAFGLVKDWLACPRQQIFMIAGLAGTGKTQLARILATTVNSAVFGTYTGKAALAMRRAGCNDASTLHKLIYSPKFKRKGTVEFWVNHVDSPIMDADLVIVDEISMVGRKLGEALLGFGKKLLVLGDPAQLPPVETSDSDAGFLTNRRPDVFLSEVHRQAAGSPILRLATLARQGERLPQGDWDQAKVIPRGKLSAAEVCGFDTVIVGRNATRHSFNQRLRAAQGRGGPLPEVGDKLLCCRNDHKTHLLNGEIFIATKLLKSRSPSMIRLKVRPEDDLDLSERTISVHEEVLQGKGAGLDWKDRKRGHHFEYGYAMTCHKAQGSQWPRVIVYDESEVFGVNADRWLYTAITRASEHLTIVV